MDLSNLAVGDAMPDMARGPITKTQLALFAGASGDHNPIHLDDDEARSSGLPGVIVHGMLTMAILSQLLTEAVPLDQIRGFTSRFKAMAFPGDTLTCKGTVTARQEEGGETLLDLDLIAQNQKGEPVLQGTARIAV